MKIKLAKNISFCCGVKAAEKKILELREKTEDDIYIFGELIHNKIFNEYLKKKRIYISEDFESLKNKTIVIRTHGVSPLIEDTLKKLSSNIIDLTCPKVKAVHKICDEYSKKNYFIIITGDPKHPEVKGITGYTKRYKVISSVNEAEKIELPQRENILILSQTTFNLQTFEKIVETIKNKNSDIIVKPTICEATYNRQKEAADIAKTSDLVVIIGDKRSSNTKKLYEITKEINENVIHIESEKELPDNFFKTIKDSETVGIISGASTPIFIIEKVIEKIKMEVKNE